MRLPVLDRLQNRAEAQSHEKHREMCGSTSYLGEGFVAKGVVKEIAEHYDEHVARNGDIGYRTTIWWRNEILEMTKTLSWISRSGRCAECENTYLVKICIDRS